ncbi:MAG: chromate transporter [Burkholderiales bacterium]
MSSPPPAPEPEPAEPDRLRQPASPAEMFRAFNRLALQGFGGVLPVAQRELVERQRWLSREQFLEMLALAQVLPGPNIINLSLMIGDRAFGWRGVVASMAGLMLVPLLIVLILATLYGQLVNVPAVAGALRGMGAVAAGLVIATAIKLVGGLRRHPLGLTWCLAYAALTVVAVGALRWPMAYVVIGLGGLAMAHVWWQMRRSSSQPTDERTP